ncbi:hypothetical protein [Kaistia adipata]|uniref:hypothetical protein n=1 Tax=Kaistia adipata TaxID=166954 RepID=UPI00048F2CEE|nr:hypothetical protein [Kaistia adipata]
MMICGACGEPLDFDADGRAIASEPDIDLAIHALTKGMGDETRRLPDVLTYLVRAIPDLHPITALLERETGRKLTP